MAPRFACMKNGAAVARITIGVCSIISNGPPLRRDSDGFTRIFRDQRRVIKDSGHWYGRLAATGSLT
jgi:hypothetical protein